MPDTGDNTGVVQDANIIAYLDTYPIEREEFQFYAARNRALVAQNFKTVYNAKVTDDFWTTKYGDDTPEEMLREEALEELINTKAELILMKEYGIIKDISYSAFIKEWIDTNTARSQALRRGANLYGPVLDHHEPYQAGKGSRKNAESFRLHPPDLLWNHQGKISVLFGRRPNGSHQL